MITGLSADEADSSEADTRSIDSCALDELVDATGAAAVGVELVDGVEVDGVAVAGVAGLPTSGGIETFFCSGISGPETTRSLPQTGAYYKIRAGFRPYTIGDKQNSTIQGRGRRGTSIGFGRAHTRHISAPEGRVIHWSLPQRQANGWSSFSVVGSRSLALSRTVSGRIRGESLI